jgi:hypothetical protein
VLGLASGELDGATAGRMVTRMVDDAGIDPCSRAGSTWTTTTRRAWPPRCPMSAQRRLVQVLQFTLPGAPNLYYGSEVGMTGGDDPEMRAPMRWDLAAPDNPSWPGRGS